METKITQIPLIDAVPGGIIERGALALGSSVTDLITRLLYCPMTLPYDVENKETVSFLPCHTVGGNYGPVETDVLVLGKIPSQLEVNQGLNQFGPTGDLWQPLLRKKGINIDNWLLYNIVPFKVPDYLLGKGELKQIFVKEAQCLVTALLSLVQPKYILCMGSDATKGLFAIFDKKKKIKFTESRGCTLELPNGTKVICINNPSAIIKSPEMFDEFERVLDRFVNLVSPSTIKAE